MASRKSRNTVWNAIRSNVLTGAFVLAPMGAVFWIILWLWNLLTSFSNLFPASLHPRELFHLRSPLAISLVDFVLILLTLGILIAFVAWIGSLSRNYLGKQVLNFIRRGVAHIPVLSTVYSTLEQLFETFSGSKTKNFRRVVRVAFPHAGAHTLALVTGERSYNGKPHVTVYVPTTPNPTGGYYLMFAESEVESLDMSVEDALKEIISMGLVKADREHG